MSISIDTNLIYRVNNPYQIQLKRKNLNAYKSIDEVTDLEAAKTATLLEQLKSPNCNYEEIVKSLKLEMPKNRLKILKELNHNELFPLLYLMEKDKLLLGMRFFDKEKLLRMIFQLPKEQLLKMLMQKLSPDELLTYFPIKALTQLLHNHKIDQNMLIKLIKGLPKQVLLKILESVEGKPLGNKSQDELMVMLKNTKQAYLLEGIKSLPYKELLNFISQLVKSEPQLLLEFPKQIMFKPFERMQKSTIIEAMQVLDPDLIINMLGQLPQDMLSQVVTLLDAEQLSDTLQHNFKGLLSQLAA